jgi:hypothetical protein
MEVVIEQIECSEADSGVEHRLTATAIEHLVYSCHLRQGGRTAPLLRQLPCDLVERRNRGRGDGDLIENAGNDFVLGGFFAV